MPAFTDLLRGLLETGVVRLRHPPTLLPEEREPALSLLESAFRDHSLDVAGPAIAFDPEAALAASGFAAWSCWYLLHREASPATVERTLILPRPPRRAAEHLSADVVARFLPGVHRRARVVAAGDVLTSRLEEFLRRWPLSGVLADLEAPPLEPVELDGHPGLLLLYAERLAQRPRPSWVADPAREIIELVFAERELPVPR